MLLCVTQLLNTEIFQAPLGPKWLKLGVLINDKIQIILLTTLVRILGYHVDNMIDWL